jgi:hypothetical protein
MASIQIGSRRCCKETIRSTQGIEGSKEKCRSIKQQMFKVTCMQLPIENVCIRDNDVRISQTEGTPVMAFSLIDELGYLADK